jgi:xylan 1,4-beta-xylosidase
MTMQTLCLLAVLACLVLCAAGTAQTTGQTTPPATTAPTAFSVSMTIDAAQPIAPWKPVHRFFGADEPNYAYMKDGRRLLAELGELDRGNVYFRTHNLLSTGDATPALKWGSTNAYTEDKNGKPIYDWTVVDRIFDTYLKHGVRPYVQIGFMPEALSIKPTPYQHEWRPGLKYDVIGTGWAYPPNDWNKWQELVYQWALHCVERYGMEECEKWYWQTWNEPNGSSYWKGTPQEFHRLHDLAIHSVRRAIPKARVGGADTIGLGGKFAENFFIHCLREKNYATGEIGTPLDFVSFHAKGNPKFVNGHVQMGISNQLKGINDAFALFARYPELKDKPIVIGESDPDGCAACQGKHLDYRNGTLYSSYTAASFARKHLLADKHGVNLEGALTWAFEFEDQPYFAGQRVLASNGIDLPVMNVFRCFSRMGGQRVRSESSEQLPLDVMTSKGVRDRPDVGVMATHGTEGRTSAFLWHYHDDDVAGPDAEISINFTGLKTAAVTVERFRIDEDHSNAFGAWKKMGSPTPPNDKQYADLVKAGALQTTGRPSEANVTDGKLTLKTTLPRQGVELIVLSPK